LGVKIGNIGLYYAGVMKAKEPSIRPFYLIGWVGEQKLRVHIQKIRSMVAPEKKRMEGETIRPYNGVVEGLRDQNKVYS
jgi:hypothetical protein